MKIVLILNDDFSMWQFFRGLIRTLKARHTDVFLVTPSGPYVPLLVSMGAKHVAIDMDRFISPLSDIRFCFNLYRLFRTCNFDIVCNMTVKPNVYGSIVARLAGVRSVVGMIEGLGYGLAEGHRWRDRLLRYVVLQLYWVACTLSDRIGFANPDDLSLFVDSGIVKRNKAIAFRSMIGISLKEYDRKCVDGTHLANLRLQLGLDESIRTVVMVAARIIWSKGVKEFVEASEIAPRWPKKVRFLLIGPLDLKASDAVEEICLHQRESSWFRWLGFRNDVREILALSDVVVLPSYYREGVPRVLLEAMAMGKPIVTTNNVGCRETVDEGKNGFLVPVRNSAALASAIEVLINDKELREQFGRHSRVKAETEFDETVIVQRIIEELYEIRQ
jgi:N,N'-diacetylbacillosaminyl-diphospho-undecaprenol alpha-1,3-N-acetylgalactosaminyltransferase